MIETANLQLIACELRYVEAIMVDKKSLEPMLEIQVPDGWPHFLEVFPYVSRLLKSDPSLLKWYMYLFIHSKDRVLIGSGGFKGRPDSSGMVEIGYEIVEEYRNRGLATEAARGLIDYAFSHPEVTAVQAHTLAAPNASNNVLQKLGMKYIGASYDPEDGNVWRYLITREEYQPKT